MVFKLVIRMIKVAMDNNRLVCLMFSMGYLSSWSFGTAQWVQKFWFILFCSGVMFTMNWHTG